MTIWLTQWGSKSLGDQGYSPIEILRYYYGDDMYINTAEAISGIPSSWPGYTLEIGSSGNKVLQMQEQTFWRSAATAEYCLRYRSQASSDHYG